MNQDLSVEKIATFTFKAAHLETYRFYFIYHQSIMSEDLSISASGCRENSCVQQIKHLGNSGIFAYEDI
jgi:hypothetical protein